MLSYQARQRSQWAHVVGIKEQLSKPLRISLRIEVRRLAKLKRPQPVQRTFFSRQQREGSCDAAREDLSVYGIRFGSCQRRGMLRRPFARECSKLTTKHHLNA